MKNSHQWRTGGWPRVLLVAAVVLIVGAAAGSFVTAEGWVPIKAGSRGVPIYVASGNKIASDVSLTTGFSAVAKAAMPAVVTVETLSRVRPTPVFRFTNPFGDLFNWPFPNQGGQQGENGPENNPENGPPPNNQNRGQLRATGLGSGVIVSPDGYILTNNHVVAGADKIRVNLSDGRNFTAKLIGRDAPSDIAVLKIDSTDLPTIPIGDSSKVNVGDVVLAIGNPLGVGETVTMGIISAKGRATDSPGSGSYQDFLQTDAAINRGNSGGALVNVQGDLIGVPSQIISGSGGNIGIGFAIPSAMAKSVMDQLIKTGKVRRGELGVRIGDLNEPLAQKFSYNGTKGVIVEDVEPGKAADRAGVKAGDIITEFQGKRVSDSADLRNMVAETAPGTTVRFTVWRNGAEHELTATLGEMQSNSTGVGQSSGGQGSAGGALTGVNVESLTPTLRQNLNLPSSAHGVVISSVSGDSAAAQAGLRRGDLIEEIDHQPISSIAEFNAAVRKAGNSILLRVGRGEQGSFFVVISSQQ